MSTVLSCLFLTGLHLVIGMILPGVALRALLCRGDLPKTSLSGLFIECLALGSLWSTCQWLVIYQISGWFDSGRFMLLLTKHLSDAALIIASILSSRGAWRSMFSSWLLELLRARNIAALLLLILFGALVTIQFPAALDNAAMYWVAGDLAGSNYGRDSQGSPAYISWIYWPSLWQWPHVAPNVVVAGAKVPLALLCWLVICQLFRSLSFAGLALPRYTFFLTLPASFMGAYGLVNTGKETVFGVLFLFGAGARMIGGFQDGGPRRLCTELGAWLALAFGFGAITIPYAVVWLALYFILHDQKAPFSTVMVAAGKWCAIPLALSFTSMLHLPLWSTSLAMVLLVIITQKTGARLDRGQEKWAYLIHKKNSLFCVILWLSLVAFTFVLLPVRYPLRDMFPLDGTSDFRAVFLTFNNTYLPSYVGWLGLAGMLFAIWGIGVRQAHLTGLRALACFPFAAFIPSLVLAHFPEIPLPIHPQHLWDLAKDVPNWCWGIIATFFSIYLVITLTSLIFEKVTPPGSLFGVRMSLLISGGFMCLHVWHLYGREGAANLLGLRETAFFTSTGGARNPDTAVFCDALTRMISGEHASMNGKIRRPELVFDPSAEVISKKHEFGGTGVRLVQHESAVEAVRRIRHDESILFLICGVDAARGLLAPNKHFREIARHGQDSLFNVELAESGAGRITEWDAPPFVAPRPPLLEALLGKPRVVWDDFADSGVITKDNDPYLWMKARGTLWLEVPAQWKSDEFEIGLRSFGGAGASIRIESPMLEKPLVLEKDKNKVVVKLRSDYASHTVESHDSRWMRFDAYYDGPLIRQPRQPYLKSIRLDRLVIGGHEYLR